MTPSKFEDQEDHPVEASMQPGFEGAASILLESIPNENPYRDGLLQTPKRFGKAMAFMLSGYSKQLSEVIPPDAIFEDEHLEPITVKDIDVFSLCEHHLLPFFGKVHISYTPRDGKIVGLSKLARLAEMFSRRLQVQERLTRQIADALEEVLDPLGVGVIVECSHMCMTIRGVQQVGSCTVTSTRRGCFEVDDGLWSDFQGQVFRIPGVTIAPSSIPACTTSQATCCHCPGFSLAPGTTPLSPPQEANHNADDYRLYTQCSTEEFDKMILVIQNSCFGNIANKAGGFSLLDVGASTGHVLKKLISSEVNIVPTRYVALEPEEDARQSLLATLQSSDLSYEIKNNSFDSAVSVAETGGPFDVVILGHVLYGMPDNEVQEIVAHSLQFVAPGGILLIFHCSSSHKLDVVRKYLVTEHMMFHQEDYCVRVDVENLTADESRRMEAYTKSTSNGKSIHRSIRAISLEPSNCRPIQGDTMRDIIHRRTRSSVVPAAICTPNSVVGIQACLRAASEQKYGFGSVSVIGGGHSMNCIAAGALAIDMSCWKKVELNHKGKTVCAGGGATCGEITLAAEKEGLLVPLGDRPGVGVGLIIAGGINHFMRQHGLAIDGILFLSYLTPSGELLTVDDEEHLMQFRGAGASFGVILQVHLRAHDIGNISNRHAEYHFKEWAPSSSILGRYSEWATKLETAESIDAFVLYKADKLILATSHFHLGEGSTKLLGGGTNPFHDHPSIASLTVGDTVSNLMPSDLYDRELYMTELFSVQSSSSKTEYSNSCKLRSVKKCVFFRAIPETEMIESMKNAPTKWCYVHILHGGGGVANTRPELSAFCTRNWNFAAVITGRWPDGSDHLQRLTSEWVERTTKILLPHATGVYSTDLGPDDHDLKHLAYEQRNLRKLAELKRRSDPLMIFPHTCPLINQSAMTSSSNGDPVVQSRGVVVIVCGRRMSGKDWLGNIIHSQLKSMMGEHAQSRVNVVSISERTKLAYAREVGIDGDLLLRSRAFKEQHRSGLKLFYDRKKMHDPAYDRKCFIEAVQDNCNDGILVLTGLRDGIGYASLAGRPVIFVLVKSDDDTKRSRGWKPAKGIDESTGELVEDIIDPDLLYTNNIDSTAVKASAWVVSELAPAIVKSSIREVQNAPREGVVYKDIIGGLFIQPFGVALVSSLFVKHIETALCSDYIDAVLAPEAVGFTLAGPVARHFCLPLLLARKAAPSFGTFHTATTDGSNMSNLTKDTKGAHHFFMLAGTVVPGQRVLVVDDCLATGATLEALAGLVNKQGGTVTKLVTLMEMVSPELKGRQVASERGIDVFSLTTFQGL